MKLRFKILSGFFALALMLALAGVWSIYELNTIGTSAHDMLKDNYQSVHAANIMLEALEREDSGILLLMLGKWEEGRKILDSGDSLFWSGFDIAQHNLTIPGENNYIDIIREKYAHFKQVWEKPIVSTYKERNVDWYFENIHADFLATKTAINDLRHINSETMYAPPPRSRTVPAGRSCRALLRLLPRWFSERCSIFLSTIMWSIRCFALTKRSELICRMRGRFRSRSRPTMN